MNIDLRALRVVPRNTNPDLGLLEITDDQGENPRIQAGLGTASFGQIQINTGPTASPRSSFLGATSLASPTLIADSQNGARGQLQIDSDTGSPLVILPALGMTAAVAWQMPGTNAVGALTNDGAGNMSWAAYVDLTSNQSIGGTKTFTSDVNMQANATIFNTLTLGDTLSRGRVLVQGTNNVDEIVLEANRDGFGDSIRVVDNSGQNRVQIGTVDSGDSGSVFTSGTVTAAIRGGSSALAGVYVGGQRVVQQQQTDPGASPSTEQLRQVLLAHGLIG